MTYQESGLEFNFDNNWVLKKYDSHPFYKSLSGANLKAVDFIGIWKNEILVLIEVKNYKIRYSALKKSPIQFFLSGLVGKHIQRKTDIFLYRHRIK